MTLFPRSISSAIFLTPPDLFVSCQSILQEPHLIWDRWCPLLINHRNLLWCCRCWGKYGSFWWGTWTGGPWSTRISCKFRGSTYQSICRCTDLWSLCGTDLYLRSFRCKIRARLKHLPRIIQSFRVREEAQAYYCLVLGRFEVLTQVSLWLEFLGVHILRPFLNFFRVFSFKLLCFYSLCRCLLTSLPQYLRIDSSPSFPVWECCWDSEGVLNFLPLGPCFKYFSACLLMSWSSALAQCHYCWENEGSDLYSTLFHFYQTNFFFICWLQLSSEKGL